MTPSFILVQNKQRLSSKAIIHKSVLFLQAFILSLCQPLIFCLFTAAGKVGVGPNLQLWPQPPLSSSMCLQSPALQLNSGAERTRFCLDLSALTFQKELLKCLDKPNSPYEFLWSFAHDCGKWSVTFIKATKNAGTVSSSISYSKPSRTQFTDGLICNGVAGKDRGHRPLLECNLESLQSHVTDQSIHRCPFGLLNIQWHSWFYIDEPVFRLFSIAWSFR